MKKSQTTPTPTPITPPPRKRLDCSRCGDDAWKGPLCAKCPSYEKDHYAEGMGSTCADYFCIAESPYMVGPSGNLEAHDPWNMGIGLVVKRKFIQQKDKYPDTKYLGGRFTSAVRCGVDKPNKKMKDSCYPLLKEELLAKSNPKSPIMILALGPAVLQSLGIKIRKYSDAQGKFFNLEIEGRKVVVFASLTKRQLPTKTGYLDILTQHIDIFLNSVAGSKGKITTEDVNPALPLKELIKDYRFPKTLLQVGKLVEEIINYSPPGKTPSEQVLAIDTETNTLYPHRKKLKILNILVSWDDGKSAAIPIEHADTPWTFAEVFPYVQQLLLCDKPKVFHNAKFDLRVLMAKGWTIKRYSWDTMIGEHILAEDKRGFYGLKSLTKTFLPKYSGYEDELIASREKTAKSMPKSKKVELKGAAKKLAEDDGYASVSLKQLNEYGAVDADVTRRMYGLQRKRIKEEGIQLAALRKKLSRNNHYRKSLQATATIKAPLTNLMFYRSVPATKTLADMESYGMAVDREYVDLLADRMDDAIIESSTALAQMIPPGTFSGAFNPNSPAHLLKIFFTTGYLPELESEEIVSYRGAIPEEELRKTDAGQISTDASFLKMLKAQYSCKFATALLEYRAISKARNTFVENIRTLSREDGRMHTTFHITGTATGRLSSSDENMQNVPKRIRQHNIKKIFIPTDGDTQVIVNADAKAAEVRIYAAYSQDKNLIAALCDGMDPHSFFSSVVLDPAAVLKGVPLGEQKRVLDTIGIDSQHAWNYDDFQARDDLLLTDPWYGKRLDALRKNIKRVVFGILYGASKNKISAIVGIPHEQAQAIIDVLFRMFPTIPKYIKSTKAQVELLGMVETFLGRRRRFATKGIPRGMRAKAERQAVNFKIQSTSSDIVLGVLCDTDQPIRDMGGRLLITVHDSLVFELPKQYVSQMPDFIEEYGVKKVAKEYPWLPVPFSWDVEVGPSYGELQSVDRYLAANPLEESKDDDYEDHEILNDLASV